MIRKLRLLVIMALLAFGFSACSGGNGSGEINIGELGYMAQFLVEKADGQVVIDPSLTIGVPYRPTPMNPTDANDSDKNDSVEAEESNHQVLITGTVKNVGASGGTYKVEALGTKSCEKGLCPDTNGVPSSSVSLGKPGFFSLIVPKDGNPVYVYATYTADDQSTKNTDKYLGILESRVDNVALDFSAPKPDDDDDGGVDPGLNGPTDLAIPTP